MASAKSSLDNVAASLMYEVSLHHNKNLGAYCVAVEQSTANLLKAFAYLQGSKSTGIANELLDGAQAAVIEVAACLTLGLVRPAIFSIRGQIDMALAWLYFKDHAIEWELVCATGEGFKLKRELILYFERYYPRFTQRYAILAKTSQSHEPDPYRLLSAHVHSQSKFVTPKLGNISSVVGTENLCNDCVLLQKEVADYLCDIVVALFAAEWAALPKEIVDDVRSRLSASQQEAVFG